MNSFPFELGKRLHLRWYHNSIMNQSALGAAPSAWNVNTGQFLGGMSVEWAAELVKNRPPYFIAAMGPIGVESYSEGFRAAVEAQAGGTFNDALGGAGWPPKGPMDHNMTVRNNLHCQARNLVFESDVPDRHMERWALAAR